MIHGPLELLSEASRQWIADRAPRLAGRVRSVDLLFRTHLFLRCGIEVTKAGSAMHL